MKIIELDYYISTYIHNLSLGFLLDIYFAFFALLFHPLALTITLILVFITNFLINFISIILILKLVIVILVNLAFTLSLKALTNRSRPAMKSGLFQPPHRSFYLRDLETNKSFPSGDTSCCLAVLSTLYISQINIQRHTDLIVNFLFFYVIFNVSFSRIYYGFHWFGDILGGIFIGLFSAVLVNIIIDGFIV